MTTSIFNRKTRNKPEAWRHLGFLPDVKRSKAENTRFMKKYKGGNIINTHRMLAVILESLR